MTVYTYSDEYQSAPCRSDWYDLLVKNELPGEIETTVALCEAYSDSNGDKILQNRSLITSLFCKDTYTHEINLDYSTSQSTQSVTDNVYQIMSATITDEIDPVMVATPIPNVTVEMYTTFNDMTPESEIEDLVNSLYDYPLSVYRGFATHSGELYDENGLANLEYDDYTHDLINMGVYIPTDVEYDYQNHTMNITAEHCGFHTMNAATEMSSDSYLNQRYPHRYEPLPLYNQTVSNFTTAVVKSFKMGYTPNEVFGGAFKHYLPDYQEIVTTGGGSANYGVDIESMDSITNESKSTSMGYQSYVGQEQVQQVRAANSETPSDGYDTLAVYQEWNYPLEQSGGVYQLTNIANTWVSESMYNLFASWCRQNDLSFVPTNDPTGRWMLVGGSTPTEDKVFGGSGSTPDPSNGLWRNYTQGTYDVYPNMIWQDTLIKSKIERNAYTSTKQYRINLLGTYDETTGTVSNVFDFEAFSFPKLSLSSSPDDSTFPIPANKNAGLSYVPYSLPRDSKWYDGTYVYSTAKTGAEGVGSYVARNRMGMLFCGVDNGSVLAPKSLFSRGYKNNPFTIGDDVSVNLSTLDPVTFVVDANDDVMSGDSDETTFDDPHICYGMNGVSKRVLDRVNSERLMPLYELEWSMTDDPSLRVGTAVRVAVQNRWVIAYIYKQERSFDGGSELSNHAWVIRETDEPVYVWDLNMLNLKSVYFIERNTLYVTFTVPESDFVNAQIPPIAFNLIVNGETIGYLAPSYDNQRTISGEWIYDGGSFDDLTVELKSIAYITGDTNTQPVTNITMVGSQHPRLGEIVASEEIEPLMAPDHMMRG